jgi:hypothetical protein
VHCRGQKRNSILHLVYFTAPGCQCKLDCIWHFQLPYWTKYEFSLQDYLHQCNQSECEYIQTCKVAIWFTYELILFGPKPVKSQSRFVKLFSIIGLKAQALGLVRLKRAWLGLASSLAQQITSENSTGHRSFGCWREIARLIKLVKWPAHYNRVNAFESFRGEEKFSHSPGEGPSESTPENTDIYL